ncbi:MAG: hypothetical protein ACKOZY_10595 [Flavobacteriales bacterium]
MKKICFFLAVALPMLLSAQRKAFPNAMGIRLGLGSGVTYQRFLTDRNVLEVMAYQRMGGVNLTLLNETHQRLFGMPGLKWHYGYGAHVWLFNQYSVLNENQLRQNSAAFGVDGIVGMTYYFKSIPIQVSVDWKPGANIKGSRYIEWDAGGISARYRF